MKVLYFKMRLSPEGEDENAKKLRGILTRDLAEDLGIYEFYQNGIVKQTIPSIWSRPPVLPTYLKIKVNSGIECIIERSPKISYEGMGAGRKIGKKEWVIYLNQFDINKTTTKAVEKIGRGFHGCKISIRQMELTSQGTNIEQALILIPAWEYYSQY